MDFDALLSQVLNLLQQDQRVSYRALKLRFGIDDDYIEGLKDELIYAKKLAMDEDDRVLVWTGESGETEPESPSAFPSQKQIKPADRSTQAASPPPEPHTPDAERRQLTVMFCDLVESTALSG